MERRGENGNIALFTSKPEKTPNMKIKYGHKQRRYEEKTELEKMPPENTQQHQNIQQYTKTTESTQK